MNHINTQQKIGLNRPRAVNRGRSWLLAYGCGLVVMIGLNLVRLVLTWRDHLTGGVEQIGFPIVFFEHDGFSQQRHWYVHLLAADMLAALLVAWFVAHFFHDGIGAGIRRLRTVGVR